MSDIRIKEKFCIVTENESGKLIIGEFLSGRIETLQKINVYNKIDQVPVENLPELPKNASSIVKNKLYKSNNKAVGKDKKGKWFKSNMLLE